MASLPVKLQRVSGDAGGSVDYKVIARVSISSNLMSSKNLTSSSNAANQINLNYSIDSTEVESLLGKTFEMRRQPLQCICNRRFQISAAAAASRLLRITAGSELRLRIPAGSAWNIGLKLRVFALDLIFLQTKDRKTCFLGPKTRQLSKPFQSSRVGGGWWVCDPVVGGWWVVGGRVGSHNTRGRSYGSGPDCHVAHMTRVNR